jgi:hypothetical protein
MAALDTTAFAAALKTKYPAQRMRWMAYKKHPFLALVPKDEKFGGKNKSIGVRYGTPQGASATFATAQANKLGSKMAEYLITRVNYYALASITGEVMEASQGDANALLDASKFEIEGAMQTASRTLALALYRNGGGCRGKLDGACNVATDTIVLASVSDVVNWEVGMKLCSSATDGTSGAVRAGTCTVKAIDRDTGTITLTAAMTNGIGAAANTDYLFQEGDFGLYVSGVDAWNPTTAPGATAFYTVDRSIDVVRLGGLRVTAVGATMEEKLINAVARSAREGAEISHIFMNPLKRADLVKGLGSKIQYNRIESDVAGIGFKSVEIETETGPAQVISDPDCPYTHCRGLQLDTWELCSLGQAPKFINMKGQDDLIVEASADAMEIRVGYRAQLGCYAPGWNFYMGI